MYTQQKVTKKKGLHTHDLPNILSRKIRTFLHKMKNDKELEIPNVYSNLCECGNMYMGQKHCFMETRVTVNTITFTSVPCFVTPESRQRNSVTGISSCWK
jgi:hypothetical protein